MLFDKNGNGIDEIRELVSFIHGVTNIANLKMDIELAEEDIKRIISKDVYDLADEHYTSSDYKEEDQQDADLLLLDQLVSHIQLPVLLHAYRSYLMNADVSHTDTGRKVIIDPENEKMAWEWMLRRDENSILSKAYKATDRLLQFLDDNEIQEWVESTQYIERRSLFVNTAKDFSDVFFIDESRRLFLILVPMIKEVERKKIMPVLGETIYSELKGAIQDGSLDDDQQDLLDMIRVPLALFTAAIALSRLPIEVLPSGIFEDVLLEKRETSKTSLLTIRTEVRKTLEIEAERELRGLQEYLASLEEYDPPDLTEKHDTADKFFMP